MLPKRTISRKQKQIIYFNTPPWLIGEAAVLTGLLIPFFTFPKLESLLSLIFLIAGGYFINRKIINTKQGTEVLTYGIKAKALLTAIHDTNEEHNQRTVKEYTFTYQVEGEDYQYKYRSAYRRHLELEDRLTLYYLPYKPDKAFIPELYKLKLEQP